MIDPAIREDFPLLTQDDPPIHFDNACMTLKPRPVIEAIRRYYEETPFCAGRSTYRLTGVVEEAVGTSRKAIGRFVTARTANECVFLRNTTEAINLVAKGLDLPHGSTVLTTDREHNSNLVPWQRASPRLAHEAVPSTDEGTVDLGAFERRLAEGGVGLVSVVHMSNLDGYVAPIRELSRLAHDHGAKLLVDGAQYAPHAPLSVRELGCDLYALSVHKMMGPTGVGVLWGRPEVLETLEPLSTGGSTIEDTTLEGHELLPPPARFEAGLQDFAGLVATRAAVEYLERLGMTDVHEHEAALSKRLHDGLVELGAEIIGAPSAQGNGITSFRFPGIGIHELAMLFEDKGDILVRAGAHCLNAYFNARGLDGSVRASLYAYNTPDEVERFLGVCEDVVRAIGAG